MKVRCMFKKRNAVKKPMCPNCLNMSLVITGNDSFADFGREENGIVNYYTCELCGCEVEAWVTLDEQEDG